MSIDGRGVPVHEHIIRNFVLLSLCCRRKSSRFFKSISRTDCFGKSGTCGTSTSSERGCILLVHEAIKPGLSVTPCKGASEGEATCPSDGLIPGYN